MQHKEKIYVSIIVVLSIILFLKSKKKPQQSVSCPVCPSATTSYVPIYVPSAVTNVTPSPVLNNPVLAEALVYNGPVKFKVPQPKATDERGILYYQEGDKFFKISYVPETYISTFTPQEISKQEMINAWKSTNP